MKKVILSSNPYRDKNFKTLRQAKQILEANGMECKVCLVFDVEQKSDLPRDIAFTAMDEALPGAELLICFGGDGTVLHASKVATKAGIPVLGVNIGNMGYLAEVDSGELEILSRLAGDDYFLDRRMMLRVQVLREGQILFDDIALNDAVVTKSAVARTVHLSVASDEQHPIVLSGDGVIVCTPTGSTAYCMSAGGPLVEPTARCMVVTPICSHDLMSKSFVLSAGRTVTIRSARQGRKTAYLSLDGGRAIRLLSGDTVQIRQSELDTQFLHLRDRSMFEIINAKFRK